MLVVVRVATCKLLSVLLLVVPLNFTLLLSSQKFFLCQLLLHLVSFFRFLANVACVVPFFRLNFFLPQHAGAIALVIKEKVRLGRAHFDQLSKFQRALLLLVSLLRGVDDVEPLNQVLQFFAVLLFLFQRNFDCVFSKCPRDDGRVRLIPLRFQNESILQVDLI